MVWITCGLLWCFYQLFGLSFWRHPFTAEDSLLSKWCNATFLQIFSDEKSNSSPYCMAWGWVHFKQFQICGWTIPLNILKSCIFLNCIVENTCHTGSFLCACLTFIDIIIIFIESAIFMSWYNFLIYCDKRALSCWKGCGLITTLTIVGWNSCAVA